jgi:hypothetical protein
VGETAVVRNCRGIRKMEIICKVGIIDYLVSSYCRRGRDRRGEAQRKIRRKEKENKKIRGEKKWKKGD